MAFTLPDFNLLANVWTAGRVPSSGAPDVANVPLQVYVFSRMTYDNAESTPSPVIPTIILRLPTSTYLPVVGDVFDELSFSPDYYRVQWVQRMHIGFPNEYVAAVSVQCDVNGHTPR
jgi:hypothetical protein